MWKRTSRCVSLWGLARRGQACSADCPENAKETSPAPARPSEDTSPALVWLQSSVRQSISLHSLAFLPLRSPVWFSDSLRLKCFHTFLSLCFLLNRRRWAIFMMMLRRGKCPVMLKNCGCLATVKSTCEWVWNLRIFPLVKSARMYAQVCFGNYLFKLFKKCMSKHPYQYFVLGFQVFIMYICSLNCKLTLQSLLFLFSVKSGETTLRAKPQLDHICQHFTIQVLRLVILITGWC